MVAGAERPLSYTLPSCDQQRGIVEFTEEIFLILQKSLRASPVIDKRIGYFSDFFYFHENDFRDIFPVSPCLTIAIHYLIISLA